MSASTAFSSAILLFILIPLDLPHLRMNDGPALFDSWQRCICKSTSSIAGCNTLCHTEPLGRLLIQCRVASIPVRVLRRVFCPWRTEGRVGSCLSDHTVAIHSRAIGPANIPAASNPNILLIVVISPSVQRRLNDVLARFDSSQRCIRKSKSSIADRNTLCHMGTATHRSAPRIECRCHVVSRSFRNR